MNRNKNTQKGFSLLELLVVISIMGILITLGVVAFSTAQKKTRDSRRRADVKAMQDAFEQYMSATGTYETCNTMATYDAGSGAIMPGGIPTDPKNTGSYVYNTSTACSIAGYCICAYMESGTGNANAPTGATCSFGAGSYYCLTNLQ